MKQLHRSLRGLHSLKYKETKPQFLTFSGPAVENPDFFRTSGPAINFTDFSGSVDTLQAKMNNPNIVAENAKTVLAAEVSQSELGEESTSNKTLFPMSGEFSESVSGGLAEEQRTSTGRRTGGQILNAVTDLIQTFTTFSYQLLFTVFDPIEPPFREYLFTTVAKFTKSHQNKLGK